MIGSHALMADPRATVPSPTCSSMILEGLEVRRSPAPGLEEVSYAEFAERCSQGGSYLVLFTCEGRHVPAAWRRLLEAQIACVQPTSWRGEQVARLCFVNPRTTIDHVRAVLGTMS